VNHQLRLLGLDLVALVAAARVRPAEHESAHPLGVSGGVLDRDRAPAGQAQQGESLEPRGVHHGSQIADVGLERRRAIELAVR
jgi:hypothetical protein